MPKASRRIEREKKKPPSRCAVYPCRGIFIRGKYIWWVVGVYVSVIFINMHGCTTDKSSHKNIYIYLDTRQLENECITTDGGLIIIECQKDSRKELSLCFLEDVDLHIRF